MMPAASAVAGTKGFSRDGRQARKQASIWQPHKWCPIDQLGRRLHLRARLSKAYRRSQPIAQLHSLTSQVAHSLAHP
jgi:hypothetical protein